jgi:endonuclease/exonuclease/phosphatase family metal-dependent hydrolase
MLGKVTSKFDSLKGGLKGGPPPWLKSCPALAPAAPEVPPHHRGDSNLRDNPALLRSNAEFCAWIQEFNTTVPVRQWVNGTLGQSYGVAREAIPGGIPNGVISRYPIVGSGSWDDPQLENREFFRARIRLPGGRGLWAVSRHLHAKAAASRAKSATALVAQIRKQVPKDALLVVGR